MKKYFLLFCLLVTSAFAAENTSLHFHLRNQNNQKVTEESYAGEYTLVMLGTSHCHQLCGAGLGAMKQVLAKSPKKITALFIGTDTKRDTPTSLKKYLAHFDRKIIGATGTASQIADISAQLSRLGSREDKEMKNPIYASYIYLFNPDGNYVARFTHNANPQVILQAIQ